MLTSNKLGVTVADKLQESVSGLSLYVVDALPTCLDIGLNSVGLS